MGFKGFRRWSEFRIRTSSLAKDPFSLRELSKNPGTKDRPRYIHADEITIQSNLVTVSVEGKKFSCNEIEFDKINGEKGVKKQDNSVGFYYFDVFDTSTRLHLRVWITEKEMTEALIK
jgi:hypothetical protein